jgi:uncharacterized repeat protein (TIGR03803 family)
MSKRFCRRGNRLSRSKIEPLEVRRMLSGYTLTTLATFNGTNGGAPAGLTLSDGTLYGTMNNYDDNGLGYGAVFSVPVTGGSPTTLATFNGTNGVSPNCGLALSGTILYGTTYEGGAGFTGNRYTGNGTVFSVPITGDLITTLATFNFTNGEGPMELTISDSTLYGATESGGANDAGVVFSVPVTGGSPTTVATFNLYTTGGAPQNLTVSGNTLYGISEYGGNGNGSVVSVPTTGGSPTTLANFNGTNGNTDNGGNQGCLILSGGMLYGTTVEGGANDDGTVFSVPLAGGSPTTLATFNGTNGASPNGGLVLLGSTLYGTTRLGGANGDGGTVFSVPVTGGSPTTLVTFNGNNGAYPSAGLTLSGSTLYGTTQQGGAGGYGTVFALTPSNQLVFATGPTNTPGGVPIGASGGVTVNVEDSNGNLQTSDDSDVTIEIETGPDSNLQGTLTEPVINGVATFSDLSLGTAGSYTLQAVDGSYTPATSNSFEIGPIELQGSFSQGTSNGPVQFGLTPVGGASFVPLVEEEGGSVSYDDEGNITASGTFTSLQSDLGSPLFDGSFSISQGQVTTSTMNVSAGVTIAGLDTSFSSLTFATGSGGTTNDSYLQLGGGFTLPSSLGSLQITLPASIPFTVGTKGLGISPGAVNVPNQAFALDNGLEVSATDMSFDYIYSNNELQITGDFTASLKEGTSRVSLDLNLAGPNNYIDYEPERTPSLKVVGSLTYSNPNATSFFNNWFSITGASIQFDNATGGNTAVSGSLTIQTPEGQFTGQLGFLNGYLDSFNLSGAKLAIPLEPPGLFLQTVGGGLAGLAPDDPNDTEITGVLGFRYGGLVTATLTGSVQLNEENTVDAINGTVSVNIANGVATGSADFEDDIEDGTFGLSSLSMQAFSNTISVQGSLTGSDGGVLSGSLAGTFTLPKFVGGGSVSGTLAAYISSSSDTSQSYLAGSVQVSSFGTVSVRYAFNGNTSFSVTALSLGGTVGNWTSQLDLSNNALDVIGGTLSTINNQVKEGYSSGTWSGSGIASSAAAVDTTHLTALAVVQNNEGGTSLFNASNPYDGIVPGATDVLVKYTYYGDTNLDGKVDGSDYSRIDNGYLNQLTGWFSGDFNYDGIVNGSDYTLIDNAYNMQGASLAAQIFAAGATPVARVASQIAGAGNPLARAAYVPPNLFNQSPITLPDAGQETVEARIQQRDLLDRLDL